MDKLNPKMCVFFYLYSEEGDDADDYCIGCDGFNCKCDVHTPLKGTAIWEDFCAKDTARIEKEDKEACVLWRLTIASEMCKKCKGRSETCLARMNAEEFEDHREYYEEMERDFYESRMGKCE